MSNHVCGGGLAGVLEMVMSLAMRRTPRNRVRWAARRQSRRALVGAIVRAGVVS